MNNGIDQISIMDLTENVRLLNKKRADLFALLEHNSQSIITNLTAIYDLKFGLRHGSIVESGGEEFRVASIVVRVDHEPKGKPWVYANPQLHRDRARDPNKNGGFATVVKNLQSDWEPVTK